MKAMYVVFTIYLIHMERLKLSLLSYTSLCFDSTTDSLPNFHYYLSMNLNTILQQIWIY